MRSTEPQRSRSGLFNPHRLGVHEFPDSMLPQLASVARVLDPAERNARVGRHHLVDEHHARVDLISEALTFQGIVSPRALPETEASTVGDLNRLIDFRHAEHARHGTATVPGHTEA